MPFKIPFGLEGVFAQVFGQVMGEVAQAQTHPLMRSILIWVSTVQANVVERWQPIVASGIRCGLRPKMPDGRFAPCGEPAIGACGFCHAPTCLTHAMIDAQANVLCYKCLAEAARLMGAPPRQTTGTPPGRPLSPDAAERAERRRYLRVLGLRDPVTSEEIAQEFRALMKKHHPDRAPEDKQEAARKRAAAISEAYHWLTDDRRKKVA